MKSVISINKKWFFNAPFFSEFIFRMKIIKKHSGTAGIAIDTNTLILLLNEHWFDSLPDAEKEGVLVHEIMHIVNLSSNRGQNKDRKIFNIATDACINEMILKMTIKNKPLSLPDGRIDINDFIEEGFSGDHISEVLYSWIMKNIKKMPIPHDDHSFLDNNNLSDIEKEVVKDIVDKAKMRSYGEISLNIKMFLDNLLNPKLNWQKLLRNEIMYYNASSFNKKKSWSRMNRRDDFLQGFENVGNKIIVAVDTSASTISYYKLMEKFFTEIEIISKNIEEIILIQCDNKIKSVQKYKKNDWSKIKIVGHGGTDIQPVFDYILEKKIKKFPLFYFTDGEFSHDFNSHNIKTTFIIAGGEKEKIKNHKMIYIDE